MLYTNDPPQTVKTKEFHIPNFISGDQKLAGALDIKSRIIKPSFSLLNSCL